MEISGDYHMYLAHGHLSGLHTAFVGKFHATIRATDFHSEISRDYYKLSNANTSVRNQKEGSKCKITEAQVHKCKHTCVSVQAQASIQTQISKCQYTSGSMQARVYISV